MYTVVMNKYNQLNSLIRSKGESLQRADKVRRKTFYS